MILLKSFKKYRLFDIKNNYSIKLERLSTIIPKDKITEDRNEKTKTIKKENAFSLPLNDGSNKKISLSLYRKILRLLQIQDQNEDSFQISFKLVREEFMNNKNLPTQGSIDVK